MTVPKEPAPARRRDGYRTGSPGRLLRRRLTGHIREQLGMIRTVADWTVMLYLIIPGLLLGGRYYYGYWQEPLPGWSLNLPLALLPGILALGIVSGGLLLLLHEGDLLFLRQQQRWVRTLMLGGTAYSLLLTALKLLAVWGVMLPFLIRGYAVSWPSALALAALTLACGWCVKLLRHLVLVQRQGWRRWLWLIPAAGVPAGLYVRAVSAWMQTPALLWLAAAVYLAGAALALRTRLSLRGSFTGDVREDFKQRMRIAAFLLSGVIDKPRPTRYRPWIFRKSQTLLATAPAEKRLTEAGIKALVRHTGHLKLYLQFLGVSLAAIFIVPYGFKWLVIGVLLAMLSFWLVSFWKSLMGEEFAALLPFSKEQRAVAGTRAVLLLSLPYSALTSLLAAVQLYGWWGIVFFLPAGFGLSWVLAGMFAGMRLER
ncbi:ABC transporter permease [Paenibacillus spiritus]|uniref:ABC transporter permease n=1 Tax=Paenibacillus spiritus TaxID=2496557 RepID=UPI00168B1A43|nr:ABC transporter permease [Paenibacillus spiritus]